MSGFPDKARGSRTGRPINVLLDLLGNRWTLRILWELRDGPHSFRELQSRCDQVSPTMLNKRLKELRDFDLAELTDPGGYALTARGRSLCEHLTGLNAWAKTWAATLGKRAR